VFKALGNVTEIVSRLTVSRLAEVKYYRLSCKKSKPKKFTDLRSLWQAKKKLADAHLWQLPVIYFNRKIQLSRVLTNLPTIFIVNKII
jgi:hypothetical protein